MHAWRAVVVKWKRRTVAAEVLFVALMLGMACLYGLHPARRESWTQIRGKWRTLTQAIGGKPSVLVAPFDWSTVDLYGLAQFGDELEFLGCDVAVTRDELGTHVWHVTIWRALAPLERDYTVYVHFVRPGDDQPFFAQADHLLGHQFQEGMRPTSGWEPGEIVLDAVMLPDEVQQDPESQVHIGVWIPESGLRLPAETSLLQVDKHGRLVICQ